LKALPRFASTDLVFSNDGLSPAQSFSQVKKRLDEAMKAQLGDAFEGWTVHDLRRSFASGLGELGIQPHVIEACLNHRSGVIRGVARVYNRNPYIPEMKLAFEAWSRRVREIVTGVEPAGNVVNIAERR
jgi:integrase